ncbi:unnamed protein product [Mytilus coruscus]|uniref:EF-hand domain-containing protein n=1 Tax=Mytilus coruscus TaxID=42192 RepID=A0A6J8D8K9_MYTCO|nr:unnamed protein product [Mytilus coruscus]
MKISVALCIVVCCGMTFAGNGALNLIVKSFEMHQTRIKRSSMPDIEGSLHIVFTNTDENHDGHITVDEIVDSVVGSTGLKIDQNMRRGFNVVFGNPKYDLNENGTLEENEYGELIKSGMGMNNCSGYACVPFEVIQCQICLSFITISETEDVIILRMETTSYNTSLSNVMAQSTGNLPQQHIFNIKTFKILGGIQIGLGGILVIMGLVVLTRMSIMFYYGIPILICSGWFILTGFLPMCMSRNSVSSLKCQKIGFMVCSIIGAAVFSPIMFTLAIGSRMSYFYTDYGNNRYILSFSIAVLSFASAIVAVISASYCCCCSPWGRQQMAVLMSPPQPGMNLHAHGNQIWNTNIQKLVETTEKTEVYSNAQQFQLVGTDQVA